MYFHWIKWSVLLKNLFVYEMLVIWDVRCLRCLFFEMVHCMRQLHILWQVRCMKLMWQVLYGKFFIWDTHSISLAPPPTPETSAFLRQLWSWLPNSEMNLFDDILHYAYCSLIETLTSIWRNSMKLEFRFRRKKVRSLVYSSLHKLSSVPCAV